MPKNFSAIFILLVLIFNVGACGCGIALSPPAIFNNLKEANAFLVVDVQPDKSFSLNPYLRFVSVDKPENVTLVFPMKALPKDFKADRLTLSEFLKNQGIDRYNQIKETQSFDGFKKKFSESNKPLLALYLMGLGGAVLLIAPAAIFLLGGTVGSANKGALAHYEFEGGTLDIYDASAQGTFQELVDRLGFKSEGKVAELVEKYKDYYVAVLDLNVPSALPPDVMDYFGKNCPNYYANAKAALKEAGVVDTRKLGVKILSYEFEKVGRSKLTLESVSAFKAILGSDDKVCQALTRIYVQNAAGAVDSYREPSINEPKGLLLSMKFSPTDPIFYPVSVVESYNYPVSQQQYFVKVPKELEFQFSSSYAMQTALVDGARWYEIKNTKQDLEGKAASAGMGTNFDDSMLMLTNFLYLNAIYVSIFVYLLTLIGFYLYLRKIGSKVKVWALLLGGAFYFASELNKSGNKGALRYVLAAFAIWLLLAIL
jgi:hypothetical protein